MFLRRRLKKKCLAQKAKKEAQSIYNHANLIVTLVELLNVPESISRLAEFIFSPKSESLSIYEFAENLVHEHLTKEANASAASLLKQVEEKSKKTNRNKQRPPKKSTKSLKQAAASLPSQSSNMEEKEQPRLEQAARPKATAISPEIAMMHKLHQIRIQDLSVHARVARWSRATAETIKDIHDWDEKTQKRVYPYITDPNPDYTIACHNLAPLKRLLRSSLAPMYARHYSFVDANKIERKGWALIATMCWQGTEQMGTIFVGVGTDNVLYHAHFNPFTRLFKHEILSGVCKQLKSMAHIDKATTESKPVASENWERVGIFSVEKNPEDGKLLLTMENPRTHVKFIFYPLTY